LNDIIGRITNPNLIFIVPAIIIGITIHEFSHAYVSSKLGDPTPRLQGRVTLNPLSHLEPFGLITLIIFGFGWGRPVQIEPRYYKNPSRDRLLVSFAGPLSNLLVLIIVSLILRFSGNIQWEWYWTLCLYIVQINAMLCIFNLLPIPPLDGSKILLELLPIKDKYVWYYRLQQYAMPIFLILVFTNIIDFILNPLINMLISLAMFIIW